MTLYSALKKIIEMELSSEGLVIFIQEMLEGIILESDEDQIQKRLKAILDYVENDC